MNFTAKTQTNGNLIVSKVDSVIQNSSQVQFQHLRKRDNTQSNPRWWETVNECAKKNERQTTGPSIQKSLFLMAVLFVVEPAVNAEDGD